MINLVTNWSLLGDTPSEEGLYLACYGDVETEANISVVKIYKKEALRFKYTSQGGEMVDLPLSDISSFLHESWLKWAKIVYSSSEVQSHAEV